MRRGIEERGPIAAWLITSRGRFAEPAATRQWTVEQFLDALRTETGWAPTRTTYARWESGAARPEPENLARVVAFYEARGIEGPGSRKPEPQPVDLTKLVADLIAELQAERAERAAERAERLEWERGLVSAVQDIARGLGRQGDPAPLPHEGALR